MYVGCSVIKGLSKYLAAFGTVFVLLILVPNQAQACWCALKPDGTGYFCETSCAPHEIENFLGPGHLPVQMVTGYLTGNFIPPGVPVPANTIPPGGGNSTGANANPVNGVSRGGGGCFINDINDFICPGGRVAPPSPPFTGKPYINATLPQPGTQNPTPTPGTPPTNTVPPGNAGTAYEWPPGFGCQTAAIVGPPPVGQDPTNWSMTFQEEWNAFDSTIWNDAIWYETPNPTQNYAVEGGALKIWPQRDASGEFFNRTIDTDGNFSQAYGFFEMEAKLPIGKGTWPAFWLFNHIGNGRPEIDIMEAYAGGGAGWADGNEHPTAYGTTVWLANNTRAGFATHQTPDLSADFHTYGVNWWLDVTNDTDNLTFYFDGQPVYELRGIQMRDPMYIILDLWFGSASGQPDNTTPQGKANSYEINYVRAWEWCDPTVPQGAP